MKRIYIIGPSGSGKTTLAKKLSKKLGIPSYDLDDIFWIKKPVKKRRESLLKPRLKKLIKKKKWIIEVVFSSWVRDAVKKSDLIIWVDLSSKVLSWRLFTRYFKKKFRKEEMGSFNDTLKLIKYSRLYGKKQSHLYKFHKKLVSEVKNKVVNIKNNKQLNMFLQSLK